MIRMNPGVRWILWIFISLGLAGWLLSGQTIYIYLCYAGVILLIGGYIWTARSLRKLLFSRKTRTLRASVGEVFDEVFEIQNNSWQPYPWLEINSLSELPGDRGSHLLTNIGRHHRRTYVARTRLAKRGAYLLGPTELFAGDPLGIFRSQRLVQATDTLVVLPMTVEIPQFAITPGILPGGRVIRQKTMDVTPHAAGIREYSPGDPLRRIHWPSTAKRGQLMVKEFEQDPKAEIWFFIDGYKDVYHTSGVYVEEKPLMGKDWWTHLRVKYKLPMDSFEYIVSVTASLAKYFLQENRAVGLACAGERYTFLPSERGDRQIRKLLEALAFLQPKGKLPLHGLITFQANLLPIGSSVILVTSTPHKELLLGIEHLQRCNLKPIVVLIRSETFGGGDSSDALITALNERNIQVCDISFGDDLSNRLSEFSTNFHRSISYTPVFSIPYGSIQ